MIKIVHLMDIWFRRQLLVKDVWWRNNLSSFSLYIIYGMRRIGVRLYLIDIFKRKVKQSENEQKKHREGEREIEKKNAKTKSTILLFLVCFLLV